MRLPRRHLAESDARRNHALDGIRGLAVAAIVVFHQGEAWARGGFLGVDTFFVLSGFLITTLLLDEHRLSGSIDLARFWARRMRRILPALLLMVVAVSVWVGFSDGEPGRAFRLDVASVIGYVANWRYLAAHTSYFAQTENPSPFEHAWSLAIEEQFYLLWPLLVVGLLRWGRRGALYAVTVLGACASALAMAALFDPVRPSRAYFGTDARVQSLLLGALVAMLLQTRLAERIVAARSGRNLLHAAATAAIAVTVVLWTQLNGDTAFTYRGGITLASACAAIVVGCVAVWPHGPIGRALGIAPLRMLGRISYAVYLWHWPIQLALTHARTGQSGTALLAVRAAATLSISIISFVAVEEPIRTRRWSPVPTIGGFAITACALAAVVAVFFAPQARPVITASVSTTTTLPATTTSTLASTTLLPQISAPPSTAATTTTTAAPPPPTRVVAFLGDSVAQSLARGLANVGASYGVDPLDDATLGCGVARSGAYRLSGKELRLAQECAQWNTTWTSRLNRDRPDIVAVLVGRHEVLDRVYNDHWTSVGDPEYDAYLRSELETAVSIATSTGAPAVLLTAPYFNRPERPDGGQWQENDPVRADRFNAILRSVVAAHAGRVQLIELGAKTGPGGTYTATVDGVRVRSDGVHFTPEGCAWLARWLLPTIRSLVA